MRSAERSRVLSIAEHLTDDALIAEPLTQEPRRACDPEASFSIVIPTFERRDLVCESVRALGELTFDGVFEVIVVVDGSTDGTAEALRELETPFELRIIEQENRGASDARNRGAQAARNEILLFLDDDMICAPDLLQQHSLLYRDGADAVIGSTPIDSNSPRGFLPQSVSRWIDSTPVRAPLSPFDIFTGQLSVRRSLFQALGGFDASFTAEGAFGNEDADFGVRLLAACDVRHNPDAISRQRYVVSPRDYMGRAERAVAADIRFIDKHPELAGELFEAKCFSGLWGRIVYRPLSRLPFVPKLMSNAAVALADWAASSPFHSNRLLARFFSGARTLAYWSALRRAGWYPFSSRPLVLCYHAVDSGSDDPVIGRYCVPRDLLAKQLNQLVGRGYRFISPGQLSAFLSRGAPLPRKPVLLSFDDGYADLPDVIREVLQPHGIRPLVFAVTGAESRTNEWDQAYGAEALSLLDTAALGNLADLGVEVGAHSRSHSELPLLAGEHLAEEIAGCAADLKEIGLPTPRFFAYPYGYSDKLVRTAVRDAGFLAAFGLEYRRMSPRSELFDLPRVIVLATDKGWRFRFKTAAPALWGRLLQAEGLLKRLLGRRPTE